VARPVLIVIILTMITISLTPLSLRKILFLAGAILCLSSAACFAESTAFLAVSSTPYDHQMTRIEPVLTGKASSRTEEVSLGLVNQWMGELRAIPYGFSVEWKTPAEVQNGPAADCKGKAVALYQRMHAAGAQNVRLVIGKRTVLSRKTHAWLEWNTEAGTFVLDPTINWTACRAERLGNASYIPLYAYAGSRKYRASVGTLYARN
jgi:predicted transglutaminase-like cysteine proteinase